MLTRQTLIPETLCVGRTPIGLVTTEDGRTLLAVTEHEDGMLEIVATPLTLVTQNATVAASLDLKNIDGNLILQPSVHRASVQNDGIEFRRDVDQAPRLFDAPITLVEPTKLLTNVEPEREVTFDAEVPPSHGTAEAPPNEGNRETRSRRTSPGLLGKTVCGRSPGRPKKSDSYSPQGTQALRCDVCQQVFEKRTTYRRHIESHAEDKPHRCPKCPASFNVPSNFTLHMATHNVGEPKCPECGKKFARMASLKSHMSLHEKEENLFCTECEDAFSTKAQLEAHLKLHGEKWSTEEARKCKLCDKRFIQPALYRLHIREHYRLQTKITKQTKRGAKHKTIYKCTICLKSFQKPSQLMRHIRVHTGEKPFKCTVCGRAFTQKSSLQIHTWRHNGIRPHTCDLCNAKFSQKGNLNAHILRVHNVPEGEPIYGCTFCSCVFRKLGSLNGHIKRMHADSTQECPTAVSDENQDVVTVEADMRATVDSVISQLASLDSNREGAPSLSDSSEQNAIPSSPSTRRDILQQALKNSGLRDTLETKKLEARTNFVTLLDGAPDGGSRKYLTIRQRCVGNVRWYACSFCHKEFKKPSDLIRHLRVHTQEKPFKCTHCCRSFALKSTMIAHERTHTGAKKYACDSCDKSFACHGSLTTHARSHAMPDKSTDVRIDGDETPGGESANKISTSVLPVTRKCQTNGHSRSRPKLSAEAESLVPQVVLQEPLVINDAGNRICVMQVSSKRKRAYEVVNDIARPHKCWVCHAAFRKISHLKQHYRRHTGERPYECTKCDRRFTSNSVLKSHLHTHEDSRPYGCSICGTKFSTQSSMKRHLVTHSNKRPFMCPYCHKTFKTYVNCRKHMKIHKHELAQRQFERQKVLETQERPECETTSAKNIKPTISPASTTAAAPVSSSSFLMSSSSCSSSSSSSSLPSTSSAITISENPVLSRLEAVDVPFQSQITSNFADTFSDQLGTIADDKEKAVPPTASVVSSTIVNHSLPNENLAALGTSQMLHADETGTVTLPPYVGDQAFTSESIREIEETLNQQLFNIGMNLGLGSNLVKQVADSSAVALNDAMEQRQRSQQSPQILSVIYQADKSVQSSGNVFASQFDSFDMSQIAVQTDHEMDIGLNGTSTMSMTDMLPMSARQEEQQQQQQLQERLSIPVATDISAKDDQPDSTSCVRTVVLIAERTGHAVVTTKTQKQSNVSEISNETGTTFLTKDIEEGREECTVRAALCDSRPEQPRMARMVNFDSKTSRQESSLQCHVCSKEGFTAIALKEHLKSHRGEKEYRCAQCFMRFSTNGGLNRHSKMHANKQQWKCSMCEKAFRNKAQLRSHGKDHELAWSATRISDSSDVEEGGPAIDIRLVGGSRSSNVAVGIEPDSTVSEKVLLDTVAEKEVMDRVTESAADIIQRKEYTNKCKYCPKTFRKPSDLIRHTRTHTGERPYKCDYCSKSFAVKCTLDSHTKVHTGKKTLRCHVCSSLFATKGSLKVHMRLHTGSKPFRCPICESRFRTSGHRKVHLLKHVREHKVVAKRKQKHLKVAAVAEVVADLERVDDNTGKTISITASVVPAVPIAPPPPPAPAPASVSIVPSISRMIAFEQHQLLSPTIGGYPNLEVIGIEASSLNPDQITFENDGASSNNNSILSVNESNQLVANLHFLLANGIVTIHTDETQSIQPILPPQQSVQNEEIEQTSTIQVAPVELPPGQERHDAEKASGKGNPSRKECDICGKTFTKPYQVERHKRIHTGERPYKCELCTKSFAQKSTLQMHQKHHTGDRPHPCPHCEYSFTQKGNLRTHMKRVHHVDPLDIENTKRARRCSAADTIRESLADAKILDLDDVSFVEFFK